MRSLNDLSRAARVTPGLPPDIRERVVDILARMVLADLELGHATSPMHTGAAYTRPVQTTTPDAMTRGEGQDTRAGGGHDDEPDRTPESLPAHFIPADQAG